MYIKKKKKIIQRTQMDNRSRYSCARQQSDLITPNQNTIEFIFLLSVSDSPRQSKFFCLV